MGPLADLRELILVQSAGLREHKAYSLIRRVDLAILRFSSKLCKLYLFQDEYKQHRIFNYTNLAAMVVVFSLLGIIRGLYYHYDYDYFVLQLDRLHNVQQNTNLGLFNINNLTRLELYLTQQVQLKRRELERIGSPFVSVPSFFIECAYITWLCFIAICFNSIRNLSSGKLKTNFIRLLSNPMEEQTRIEQRTQWEVDKYLSSNLNFKLNYYWTSNEADALHLDHRQARQILQNIQTGRDIVRLYGFTSGWLNKTALFHCVNFVVWNLFYVLVGVVVVTHLLTQQSATNSDPSVTLKLNEMMELANIFVVISTIVFIGVTINLLLLIDWHDQIETINRLKGLIQSCIHTNSELYFRGRQTSDQDELRMDMNANLLFVLISFRVFPLKAKQSLDIQSQCANVALQVMFILPLVVRLHAPYCPPDGLLWLVSVSGCMWAFGISMMLVSCHLYDQTIKLHKPLASLMAHVVGVNEQHYRCKSTNLYSKHTAWCLRQELRELKRFQEPLLPRGSPMKINFTFPVLIKVQFWYNLLILSIFARTKVDNYLDMSGTDRLLNDPLGFFNDQLQ